jgi:HAD superfamily hydrolase (TIGR01509 family)
MSAALFFDLIIFDCDGVLVDSEMLSAKVLLQQLSEIGIPMTIEEFRHDFLGRGFAAATARLKARTNIDVPANFQAQYFERLLQLFETDLQPMAGVEKILQTMRIPHCVASSSIPPRLDAAMRLCDLERYFGPHVYSSVLVKNGKPAPDLFLHASRAMNVTPSRCLVIEDSEMGVMAAHAAGMPVWHFTGGAHMIDGHPLSEGLKVDRVVQNMAELHHVFCESGICTNERVAF